MKSESQRLWHIGLEMSSEDWAVKYNAEKSRHLLGLAF